jgi:ribonuclease T2
MKRKSVWLLVVVMALSLCAFPSKHKKRDQGQSRFDYYLLSLSWAPNFCASHPNDNSSECKTGNHTAFVLHGLWPNANQGPSPLSCKPASPVAANIVRHMLEYFPTKGLIQHEWEKHGTCSGLSAAQYFDKVEQAYKSIQVPQEYASFDQEQQLGVKDIEQNFAKSNNAPEGAFRLSCHAGELLALEACLDKDLHLQACPRTARECPAEQVKLSPPK